MATRAIRKASSSRREPMWDPFTPKYPGIEIHRDGPNVVSYDTFSHTISGPGHNIIMRTSKEGGIPGYPLHVEPKMDGQTPTVRVSSRMGPEHIDPAVISAVNRMMAQSGYLPNVKKRIAHADANGNGERSAVIFYKRTREKTA